MPLDSVVGAQWGDEGKGRVVDLLSESSTLVARYNGGDNAGHTVTVGEKIYKLHLIPSGIIHTNTIGVLGSGMVLNLETLVEESAMLRAAGVSITPERLWISDAVQLITPAHRLLDSVQDSALGAAKIGTTGRGIGPAYVDKVSRHGLRAGEILDLEAFAARVRAHFAEVDHILTDWYHQPGLDTETLLKEYLSCAAELRPYIRRIGPLVQSERSNRAGRGCSGDAPRRGAGNLPVCDQLMHHSHRCLQRAGAGSTAGAQCGRCDESFSDPCGSRTIPDRAARGKRRLSARFGSQPLG
jgi:adenylosuccinate synthase